MILITRQILADGAPKRFARQYQKSPFPKWQPVIEKLQSLKAPVNPDEVDSIIGNTSWTRVPRCHECGADNLPAVVQVGETPDYESNHANLCAKCLTAALKLFPL